MYLDVLTRVSAAQAVTATAVSTNTIDLGSPVPKREIGTGEAIGFGVAINVAADATTGDETYTFEVIQSANADLSAPDVIASRVVTAAQATAGQLAAGTTLFIPIPQGLPQKQFLGMRYTTGGTTPSVTVTAWLTAHSLFSILAKAYAKAFVA
jgi:hypothetical protein